MLLCLHISSGGTGLNKDFEQYMENLHLVGKHMRFHIDLYMDQDEAVDAIRKNSETLFKLHNDNDRLISEKILNEKAEELSEEKVKELEELSQKLLNLSQQSDVCLAYYIHRLLREYAVIHNNTDLLIQELYFMGLCLHYVNLKETDLGISVYAGTIKSYFSQAASYLPMYDEIKNPKTRGYIIRSLGNMKLDMQLTDERGNIRSTQDRYEEYTALFNKTMEIINSPKRRAENPEQPWDKFAYSMHADRTVFMGDLRKHYDERIAKDMLESAKYLYNSTNPSPNVLGGRSKIIYLYDAARFHNGLLSVNEMINRWISIYKKRDREDFSSEGIFDNLRIPMYVEFYASKYFDTEEKQFYEMIINKMMEQAFEYLMRMPYNEYITQLSNEVQTIAWQHSKNRTNHNDMMNYILACHPPTHIHSRMVSWLTEMLCRRMFAVDPDSLVGTFGTQSVEELLERKDEILETAKLCGLYHDIGKSMILKHISNYNRRLFNEEFAMIKYHPYLGSCMLSSFEEVPDLQAAALYHHLNYDGKGGYPSDAGEVPGRVKKIVDIISVADSLDAGTDNIGRSYAATKSFETLADEIMRWQGTRYSPYVARLLEDKEFYQKLKSEIEKQRKKIYYETYRQIELQESL